MKTIKNIKLIVVAIAVAIAGCTTEKKTEQEGIAEIPAIDTEIISKAVEDSMESVFTEIMNEIETNLEMIREKGGKVLPSPGTTTENNISQKEKIISNINSLNTLIAESSHKIEELNKQIKNYKVQNSKLEKLTERFTEKLVEHEKNIMAMKDELSAKNLELAELTKRLDETRTESGWNRSVAEKFEQEVQKHKTDLNTAYYATGTKAELKEEGVIERKGGIIGIGRTSVVQGETKPMQFTKIDIREMKKIPVNAKKAKLISVHDADSYEFQKNGDMIAELEIKNPEEFWKQSKFMVLEVK